jgi:NNP family nitrate/nitrite transporter-like MFS transporter
VFQLVSQRFPREIGIITGLVGAAGGVGGFFLPSLLGAVKGSVGSFALGFVLLGVYAGICLLVVSLQGRSPQWAGAAAPTPAPASGGAE